MQFSLRSFLGLCVALVVCGGIGAASGAVSGQAPGAAVSGQVLDALTGTPIAHAIVELRGGTAATGEDRIVETDAQGRYVFPLVTPGTGYHLYGQMSGYLPGWSGVNRPARFQALDEVPKLRLAPGQWIKSADVKLWRLGTIAGQVSDEHHQPIAGVAVRAFMRSPAGSTSALATSGTALTDDQGRYRLVGVDAGTHYVSLASIQSTVPAAMAERPRTRPAGALESGGVAASAGAGVAGATTALWNGMRLVASTFPVSASIGGEALAYPPVFYPASETLNGAVPIELAQGAVREGVDFVLRPRPTAIVTGRVDDAPATGPRPLLRLLPRGSEDLGFGAEAATTVLAQDNSFVFLNVPYGDYTLVAQSFVMELSRGDAATRFPDPPGFPGTVPTVGVLNTSPPMEFMQRSGSPSGITIRFPVGVHAPQVTDLVVIPIRASAISGRILLDAGTVMPRSQTRFSVRADPANQDPRLGTTSAYTDADDPTHAFALTGLTPSDYVLSTSALQVKSVKWKGADYTESGLPAQPGVSMDEVEITVTDKRTDVSGGIQASESELDAGVRVLVFPADPRLWRQLGWNPRRARSAIAAPDGTFRMRGLPPGDYAIIALDRTLSEGWLAPDFLARVHASTTRFSLAWGGHSAHQLRLQRPRLQVP